MVPQNLEGYLKKSKAWYEVRHHPRTITAEELAQRENVDGHHVAKVVVMREDGQYYMMVLPASWTFFSFFEQTDARPITHFFMMEETGQESEIFRKSASRVKKT